MKPWISLLVALVAAGFQVDAPANAQANAPAVANCIPMDRGYVRSGSGGACRVGLPGTVATASIPDGWVCEASSSAMLGDEMVNVLSCIPADGGSPVSLQKVFAAKTSDSLDSFLRRLHSEYAEIPSKDVLVEPRKVLISGRSAVEAASKGSAIVDFAGGGAATMEMLHHTITFENASVFYECELTTTPNQYSEALRKTHQEFCASVRFDGVTPPPAGTTSHG